MVSAEGGAGNPPAHRWRLYHPYIVYPDHRPRSKNFRMMFPSEAQLRDYLAEHLDLFGKSFSLVGTEVRTDIGTLDILAETPEELLVIECKLHYSPDATLGQLLRYMGWMRKHRAGLRRVSGVIVGKTIAESLVYATSCVPNVTLFEYDSTMSLSVSLTAKFCMAGAAESAQQVVDYFRIPLTDTGSPN